MPRKIISRKIFLRNLGLGATALGASQLISCKTDAEADSAFQNIDFNKKFKWKMVTTWPPNFPVLGEGCVMFADWVREMSGGRLDIKVYGSGELVPGLETFDAVSGGAVEMGNSAAYYWAGRSAVAQLFTSVPFGMNAQQMNAWMYSGGGLELYRRVYEQFNLVPFPAGNTGVQMGGWFNKEINTIEDFKGLKMRMPGLGGKVLQQIGGTAVVTAGSEIFTNLERGVIDATEWIGPYHDYIMGFHKIAKYYYYPGWHEPGPTLEMIVNKRAFDQLPPDLQSIIESAAYRFNLWSLSEFEAKNNEYLQKIKDESQVEVRKFPTEVLQKIKIESEKILAEIGAIDALSKEVYDSFIAFRKNVRAWAETSEKVFYQDL